jgi:DNA-binding CsgD family transcriptional regulator
MSWIVKNLILDRNQILSNLTQDRTIVAENKYETASGDIILYKMESICFEIDFENDEYNFLLQLDTKIRDMLVSGQITPTERHIIEKLSEGNSYKEVGEKLNIGKSSVRKIFNSICNKLAFTLGGIFTDEGYAEYMMDKHNLSEVEVSKMITLMESNRRL